MTLQKKFVQDITQDIPVRQCGTIVFNADNLSNVVSVELYENGEPVALGGSAVGAVIRADGLTVPLTGSISENTASVTLTEDCFAVPGQISVGIQIIVGDVKTTVLKAIYNVDVIDTGSIPAGGNTAAGVAELITEMEAAATSLQQYAGPSAPLIRNVLVPDFEETTYNGCAISKQWNTVKIKRVATPAAAFLVELSGAAKAFFSTSPTYFNPTPTNLLPVALANPLKISVRNIPDNYESTRYIAIQWVTLGEDDTITKLTPTTKIDLGTAEDTIRISDYAIPTGATHFVILIYATRSTAFAADGTDITIDFESPQIAALLTPAVTLTMGGGE